jgi:glycosyltransferase involved in cell wall biosynthesis
MTKVLHISTRHNIGGIGKLILELLSDKSIDQVFLTGVCEPNEMELPFENDSRGYKLIRVSTLQRKINFKKDITAFLQIRRVLSSEKPDIIHTHMSKAGVLGRLAAISLFSQARLVHSYHGHVLDGYFNKSATQFFILIERFIGKRTDAFLFDGNRTLHDIKLMNIKPRRKMGVILPGLLKSVPDLKSSQKMKIPGTVLVVARLEQVKRVDLVLEVASVLASTYSDRNFRVIVIGDGLLRSELEQSSIERQLPVRFLGWKENLDQDYREAELFLSVSDSEGTPISFMEAASFACPIISTRVGSVEDIVEDCKTGILCKSDPAEIAQAINFLSSNSEIRLKFGENARMKAITEFGLETFVKKHANFYESLLTSN